MHNTGSIGGGGSFFILGGVSKIFCNGLHPHAKIDAIEIINNNALAIQHNCVYPAVYPAHHPNAGAAHATPGALSVGLLAQYIHSKFTTKIDSGLVRLNAKAEILAVGDDSDMVSKSPKPQSQVDTEFLFACIEDMQSSGHSNFVDYVYATFSRSTPPFRTCKNCGGVEHFSHKDDKIICPTPEGAVPVDLLRKIRYPFGIRPWQFGKGKGSSSKGKGKGVFKRISGGRGRGGVYMYYEDEADVPPEPEIPPAEEVGPSAQELMSVSTIQLGGDAAPAPHITDDYSWNNW